MMLSSVSETERNCDIRLGSCCNLRCWVVVKALLVWILLILHMEGVGSLSRAHPAGSGSVSVHLFRAGNRNETTAGCEPLLSQVWGKRGKNQSETQNRRAVESLETRKGDKFSLCTSAIRKRGEKLLHFSYFWTGKADPCDHSHRDSLQKKKHKKPDSIFLKGERQKGEEAGSNSTENVFVEMPLWFLPVKRKMSFLIPNE